MVLSLVGPEQWDTGENFFVYTFMVTALEHGYVKTATYVVFWVKLERIICRISSMTFQLLCINEKNLEKRGLIINLIK